MFIDREDSMKQAVIIDYGIGNVFSVARALEQCGAEPLLTADRKTILKATHVILPGVGAFADGMSELNARGLVEPIKQYTAGGRPFLGICLGMQMLLKSTEEFGIHQGLGLIPGEVKQIPKVGKNGVPHKIPHIGWNKIIQLNGGDPLLDDVCMESFYGYFVHSFTAWPVSEKNRLADSDYNGCRISAIIRDGRIYGCQFHPEKSGETGLTVIRNFLRLSV